MMKAKLMEQFVDPPPKAELAELMKRLIHDDKNWTIEVNRTGVVEGERKGDELRVNGRIVGVSHPVSVEGQTIGDICGNFIGESVLSEDVLDYLLKNPWLIPESWKGKSIYFFGTIVREDMGHASIRYLQFERGCWGWYYGMLFCRWGVNDFVAILAPKYPKY